jgi:phosphate transport system substrate-binding protein
VVGLAILLASGCGEPGLQINGAGSSFVRPMMEEWSKAYKDEKKIAISYQPKGSTAGIKAMTSQNVHFGCSDAPMTEEQIKACEEKHGEVIHVPLCMGAVVPAYNLKDVGELVFDGKLLIDIFSCKITKWNDPAIKKLNPKAKLPDLKISVARRADGSGTTYIFTDYLTKVDSEAWTAGRGTDVKWHANTTGGKGNDGVRDLIDKTEGTIGYIELLYALDKKIPFGKVVNSKGKTIKADIKSVTAAAATAEIPDDLRYSITNAPGEDAYPISGTVWALVYVKQPAGRGKLIKDFLWWITHDGQELCEKLHYAPLPKDLVKKIETKLEMIK